MIKYKEYYYTVKLTGYKERNSFKPIKLYSWYIRAKDGEILEQSDDEFEHKEVAEWDAEKHIDEYWYA